LKDSILNKNVDKFIGGICSLYIGSSEEVFKCWNDKNFYHVAPPSGTTDTMCYWSVECESSTGYPEPGCHGCGGPGDEFPQPGPSITYTLTTSVSGDGSVTLDPAGGTYGEGTTVTLTADPSPDWVFVEWSGDLTGTQNPDTIVMNSDKNVTANFTMVANPPVAEFTADSTASMSTRASPSPINPPITPVPGPGILATAPHRPSRTLPTPIPLSAPTPFH